MTSQLTKAVTNSTIDFVQQQILLKNSPIPYYADTKIVNNSITDMDVFPYPRFFRGKPTDPNPNVLEREAGFRNRYQAGYTPQITLPPGPKPNVCFQPACSTIFPCLGNSDRNILQMQRNEVLNTQISYNNSM
jgi:hypothetical protein